MNTPPIKRPPTRYVTSKKSGIRWTARITERAQAVLEHLPNEAQTIIAKLATAFGCEPWEYVADSLRRSNELPKVRYNTDALRQKAVA